MGKAGGNLAVGLRCSGIKCLKQLSFGSLDQLKVSKGKCVRWWLNHWFLSAIRCSCGWREIQAKIRPDVQGQHWIDLEWPSNHPAEQNVRLVTPKHPNSVLDPGENGLRKPEMQYGWNEGNWNIWNWTTRLVAKPGGWISGSKCNFVGAVDLKQGQLVTAVNHQGDQRIHVWQWSCSILINYVSSQMGKLS